MLLFFSDDWVSPIQSFNDIIMPTRKQSEKLISHSRTWTSWVHCAVRYAVFIEEHRQFWDLFEADNSLYRANAAWLAIYFALLAAALLTMGQEQVSLLFQQGNTNPLMSNWYGAAVFCLQQADYLRKYDVRNIQAIAVLQMSCPTFGDFRFRSSLMACAVRMASALDIPYRETDERTSVEVEYSWRLWWTFVIDEW